MVVVFAVDALEHDKVEEFNCEHLKQAVYGKTDISEFSQPRTMVLWSSFMTGENKEEEILAKGDEEMWKTEIPLEETFFSKFKNPKVIDLPGFSYDRPQHDRERAMLKEFFEGPESREEKDRIRREYNQLAFEHHKKIKKEFFNSLGEGHDFALGYFSVADVIGHLNFGNNTLMKLIYDDLDEIARRIKEVRDDHLLVLSDHGMKGLGMFGDHNDYGFWSFDEECGLDRPKITDFADFLTSHLGGK
jgi:hypothetical protein